MANKESVRERNLNLITYAIKKLRSKKEEQEEKNNKSFWITNFIE